MRKNATILMLIAVVTKLLGLIRDIVITYFYGAGSTSDIFIISMTIPAVMVSFIMMGITSGYIPIYSKLVSEKGSDAGIDFTNKLITMVNVLCIAIVIFGSVFTEQIVKAFASGFEGDALSLAIKFTRISLLSVFFIGVTAIFNEYLRINEKYIIPSLANLVPNLIYIILIWISFYTNNIILALSIVITSFFNFVFLLPFVFKEGFRFNFSFDLKSDELKEITLLSVPLIIGVAVNQINILIDRTIASQILTGGISALTYAERVNQIVQGIFVISIISVMFPIISKKAASGDKIGFIRSVKEALNSVMLLVVPASIGFIIFAYPIISVLFGRGAFNEESITMTSQSLAFYSIGMLGIGLREVLARIFYSLKDTKTPMVNASLGVLINIVLNIVLSEIMGVPGLALATSLSALFTTLLLLVSLRKKIGPFGIKQIFISFLKILVASIIMVILANLLFNYLSVFISQDFSLILSLIFGAISYFIIVYFMRIDDVQLVVNMVWGKFRKKNP